MLNPQDIAPESRLVSPLEWVTVDRLAALLDVRVDHLRSLVQRREIPFGRVGKLVRFHWPTIQRWVASAAGFTASKPQPGVSSARVTMSPVEPDVTGAPAAGANQHDGSRQAPPRSRPGCRQGAS
jgi:excisionase family DNA binding protein